MHTLKVQSNETMEDRVNALITDVEVAPLCAPVEPACGQRRVA